MFDNLFLDLHINFYSYAIARPAYLEHAQGSCGSSDQHCFSLFMQKSAVAVLCNLFSAGTYQ